MCKKLGFLIRRPKKLGTFGIHDKKPVEDIQKLELFNGPSMRIYNLTIKNENL